MKDETRRMFPRWMVFSTIAIVMVISLKVRRVSVFKATPVVRGVFEAVDKLPAGSPVLISSDFDPGSDAELSPMVRAILEQCWRKKLRVVVMSLSTPNATPLAESTLTASANRAGAVYGTDYALMDFRPGNNAPILALGQSWISVYPKDKRGTPIADLPVMKGISKLTDFSLVLCIAAVSTADSWITSGNGKYGVKLGIGCTAVMATDYYPYVSSKQIVGLIGGLAGAAQYEYLTYGPDLAKREDIQSLASAKMPTQNWIHATIVALILIGNVLYYIQKRRKVSAE